MVQMRTTSIDYERKCLSYVLKTAGWKLAPLPLAPNGLGSTDKDIDGFVEVL